MVYLKAVTDNLESEDESWAIQEYYETKVSEYDESKIDFKYKVSEVEAKHNVSSIHEIAKRAYQATKLQIGYECDVCKKGWTVGAIATFGRSSMSPGSPNTACRFCKDESTNAPDEKTATSVRSNKIEPTPCVVCKKGVMDDNPGVFLESSKVAIHMNCFHQMKWGYFCTLCKKPIAEHDSTHIGADEKYIYMFHDKCFHDLRKYFYGEYLKTSHWLELAKQIKEKAGNRCQVCNSENGLHAHHRTYERLGHETDGDLVCLCSVCHELFSKNGRIYK